MKEKTYRQKVEERLGRNKEVVKQKKRAILRDEEILAGLNEDGAKISARSPKKSKSEKVEKIESETMDMPLEGEGKEKSVLDEIFE